MPSHSIMTASPFPSDPAAGPGIEEINYTLRTGEE